MARKDSRKISALLFDYGGTLGFLDFEMLAREFSRPHRKLDPLKLEHAEYRGRHALDSYLMSTEKPDFQKGWNGFWRAWMDAAGVSEEEMEEVGNRFRAMHAEASLWRVIRPGTGEALEKLKSAGIKLGIVSNADGRVEADAKRFGIAQYFDVIIDSHVVGIEKPDPRIFHLALSRLGVSPEETMFTGDIYSIDMIGARAAGITGKLIDCHGLYHWVDHAKIRHVGEFHIPGRE
jgi:putative hydrolase of the HAD superfamily